MRVPSSSERRREASSGRSAKRSRIASYSASWRRWAVGLLERERVHLLGAAELGEEELEQPEVAVLHRGR